MRTIDLALERQQKLISCWIKRCDILSKDVTKKPPEIFFLFDFVYGKLLTTYNRRIVFYINYTKPNL